MPVLFCNIAWMNAYAGRSPDDPPLGGGGFPRSHGYCGEECNFVPCDDGHVYSHFETIKGGRDRQVLIERLGAADSDGYIDGVDIVWTAPRGGNDPRVVVGWSRRARLYRWRQSFNGEYPSDQHRRDQIRSFQVKAKSDDVFLLPSRRRTTILQRGRGWSGQTSWWYADDTARPDVRSFVEAVKALMDGHRVPSVGARPAPGRAARLKRAGAAAAEAYKRYLDRHETTVDPQHDKLQKRFEAWLRGAHPHVGFPRCLRDDLRYTTHEHGHVMVEVKPADVATLRFAIRTAMGQLLDYKQHVGWTGRQLIVVGTEVSKADDLALAFDNGFGLSWPVGRDGFSIRWPPRSSTDRT